MTPRLRKAVLVAHVTTSVGWLGAVIAALALAAAALVTNDPTIVRSVYETLRILGWYVLVPFSLSSLAIGVVQSLTTRWGLLRHYWVVAKLAINVVAAAVLLLYMQTLNRLVVAANEATQADAVLDVRDPSAVVHAVVAVLLLVVATILSVYKPRGLTRRGQRHESAHDRGEIKPLLP